MIITDEAAEKVAALKREEKDPNVKLRVYIEGGGCSGFKYGFAFESLVNDDDLWFKNETHNVDIIVDSISHQYLQNAEIDYKDDKLNGSHFIIRNPDAKTSCGCGESFSA
jgi:iron-sulfur cluster insertion protein